MELTGSIITEHDNSKINNSQQSHRRPSIHVFTGFRALACLWVFAFHRSTHSADEFKTLHIEWIGLTGAAGVALFFCLSGFIMVWVYGDCAFKSSACYWSFVGRRAARLFPLYYLSLIISIDDVRCIWTTNKPCTLLNWVNILLTLLRIRTWIPYNFTDLQWNLVTWSIQTEFFFYLTFPFLLRLIRHLLNTDKISALLDEFHNKNTMKRLYLLWFFVLCVSAVPLVIRLLIHDDLTIPLVFQQGEIIYYSPFTRIPEFILGMITGIIFILKSSDNNSNIDVNTILLSNNEQRQENKFSLSLGNYFSNYKCHYLALDIYFACQIFFLQ
jgi:peptidoglycan/LPS O-acetylase OafA/YrhL